MLMKMYQEKMTKQYSGSITDEELRKLPVLQFDGRVTLVDNMEKYRYEGDLWGGGISYGYQWPLSTHWSIEAVIGAGYARLNHDKYVCENCGEWIKKDSKDYFGVTKAAISIIYVIK